MIDYSDLTTTVYKILKGFGFDVALYTEEGDATLEPGEARYVYVPDTKIMVSMPSQNSEAETILIYIEPKSRVPDLETIVKRIRQISLVKGVGVQIKTYGGQIEPKNFANEVRAEMKRIGRVNESLSGTSKSSYERCIGRSGNGKTRIIVRHQKPVNEESRGARSRNIGQLFIENEAGERHLFPVKSLAGVRAAARHVAEGGSLHDEIGQRIISLTQELQDMKKSSRSSEGPDTEILLDKMSQNRTLLRKAKGKRGYQEFIKECDVQLNEDGVAGSMEDTISARLSASGRTLYGSTKAEIAKVVEGLKKGWVDTVANAAFTFLQSPNEMTAVQKLTHVGEQLADDVLKKFVHSIAEQVSQGKKPTTNDIAVIKATFDALAKKAKPKSRSTVQESVQEIGTWIRKNFPYA